ncbi:MAG TPA: DNA gyrase C-terminal beta-propeller domain-containing protein, partial [Bacillota bacterium]|nr:DNA gyrase C-terminal beta-propeller domain-containing protein [Bacillota bacterium]
RLHELIAELEGILADINKVKQIIRVELGEIRQKYADPRRTEIVPVEDEIILEDLIERHSCIITLTHAGYIKRQPVDTYTAQNRGGRGIIGMSTKEEDFIEKVIAVNSHSYLLMFTNTGKVHMLKAYQIPEASRTAKGSNLVNILELAPGEKVTAVIGVEEFNKGQYLTMVTKFGVIKRTLLTEYEYQRRGGKIALTLDEGDELVFVMLTDGRSDLIIATRDGNAVRFNEKNVRAMGRVARGVRGISLREGDYVTGVALVEDGKKLITITENGFGKRTEFDDFRRMRTRGGFGVVCHNITRKTGRLAGISSVGEDDDIMIITDSGTIIRTPVRGIPVYSRSAAGVIVMRLAEDQSIVNFTKVASVEEEEREISRAREMNKAAEGEKKIITALPTGDEEDEAEDEQHEPDSDEEI